MTIAGLFAGLLSSRRHSTPLEATPNTTRITMKPRESTPRYSSRNDLLIRRSWDRSPPGSLVGQQLSSFWRAVIAAVRGISRGTARTASRTPEQVATLLRVRRAERDRELTLINTALRSGTTRLLG